MPFFQVVKSNVLKGFPATSIIAFGLSKVNEPNLVPETTQKFRPANIWHQNLKL